MTAYPTVIRSDRYQALLDGWGAKGENFPANNATGTLTPVSGRIYRGLFGVRAGDIINNLLLGMTAVGAGTTPTLIRVGIANAAGTQLAISNDLKANSIWTTAVAGSVGLAVAPLSAAYTSLIDQVLEAQFIRVGAWGSTEMQLARSALAAPWGPKIGSGPWRFCATSSQSDLPAVSGSMPAAAASGDAVWFGWN